MVDFIMETDQLEIHEAAAMEMGGPLADKLMGVPAAPYSDVEVKARDFSLQEIESLESKLLRTPQVEVPLSHMFAPGVYWREVKMPKGIFVIGHEHKTSHFNVILTGKARVLMNGVMHHVVAPCVITSEPGVRKILYIEEEMRWATIHPTNETDIEKLEDQLIIRSESFVNYQAELKDLQDKMALENQKVEELEPCLS